MSEGRVATDAKKSSVLEDTIRLWKTEEDRAVGYDPSSRHDNWGPCCPNCQFYGEPHKPCAVCENGRHA